MKKEIDGGDLYSNPMKAMDIDMEGIWRPKKGERTFDLKHVKFSHHIIDGQERMVLFFNNPRGYYEICPSCKMLVQEDDAIIVLENFHYLVMRHCDTMLLYKNKDLERKNMR